MVPQIKFELSAEAAEMAARLGDRKALVTVARALDAENQLTIAHISTVRMRGNDGKSWPVELHVLGIRTGRFYKSLRHSRAVVSGEQVDSAIGSNVKYAGIHEFGGTIKVGARKGVARLRENKGGTLVRQPSNGNLAVFARKTHKRVKQVAYEAKAHDIEIPARAPVTHGIQDRAADYGASVSAALLNFWGKSK